MNHHPHASMGAIAIVGTDTLRNVGLKALLERLLPMARIETYYAVDELLEQGPRRFMHYFVSPEVLAAHVSFFAERRMQTIVVLPSASASAEIPEGFHQLLTDGGIDQVVGNLLLLLQRGHAHFAHFPEAMARMMRAKEQAGAPLFTPREAEVLALVAKGHSTKEIAAHLHLSQQTVMTHRKNIMEKVGVHSATQLVVWALTQFDATPGQG